MARKSLILGLTLAIVLQLFGGSIMSAVATPMADEPSPGSSSSDQGLAPLLLPEGEIIPNRYIVVLKADISVTANADAIQSAIESVGGQIHYIYDAVLNGYSATIPAEALNWVRSDPAVEYVEADGMAYLTEEDAPEAGIDVVQTSPVWGLDRVDQHNLPRDSKYIYDTTASNVHVYVVDTGILATHTEFGSRVKNGFTAIDDGRGTSDCNGHGTHVSGTIGGTTYGVAKGVSLHPVRVFACSGGASWSTIISGLNWILSNHIHPAVVNMSLGGGADTSIDTAVNNLINHGITVVVSAGNDDVDACTQSPARVPNAITVGATRSNDYRADFSDWGSNWGTCLDLFAPGVDVKSAYWTSNTATAYMSGTSMSAPHVSGAAALYLRFFTTHSPATVSNFIINTATTGKVINPGTGSPNRLLYTRVAIPVLVQPGGVWTDNTPTYIWNKVDGASSYQYQLYFGSTLKYSYTVSSSACGTSTCSHTPSVTLANSDTTYKWRIRTYVDGAWKIYSPDRSFWVTNPASSFNNSFNGSASGWTSKVGTWNQGSAYIYTSGLSDKWNSVYRYTSRAFTNFDYIARVKRVSSPSAANCMYVRMGANVDATDSDWYPGYGFCYSNNKSYEIFRNNSDGTFTWIQSWTATPAISQNGWNKLRVIAVGPYFNFFINSTLVKTFSDSYFSIGYVGLGMYQNSTDQYQVDWAKLTVLDSLYSMTGTVDPAQEALNEAAWMTADNCTPEFNCNE